MVEGHGVHRVAASHRSLLLDKTCLATSPNNRFIAGAKMINNNKLVKIEAYGKNLFYFFLDGNRKETIIRIHFGMSGQFKFVDYHSLPEKKGTIRLELAFPECELALHLSCQALEVVQKDEYFDWINSKLGPDPLRSDSDKERFIEMAIGCHRSIGQVLMDQQMIAGVGNIYRAEILFKSKVHPSIKASELSRSRLDLIWRHSKELLHRGFISGNILTVDEEDAEILGEPWTRRYIYNQKSCGFCKSRIKSWDMSGRTCYCCEICQPLSIQESGNPITINEQFSTPKSISRVDIPISPPYTVKSLREKLKQHSLPIKGTKKELIERLDSIELFTGIEDAMKSKISAGEKLNVEHTALVSDEKIVKQIDSRMKRPRIH